MALINTSDFETIYDQLHEANKQIDKINDEIADIKRSTNGSIRNDSQNISISDSVQNEQDARLIKENLEDSAKLIGSLSPTADIAGKTLSSTVLHIDEEPKKYAFDGNFNLDLKADITPKTNDQLMQEKFNFVIDDIEEFYNQVDSRDDLSQEQKEYLKTQYSLGNKRACVLELTSIKEIDDRIASEESKLGTINEELENIEKDYYDSGEDLFSLREGRSREQELLRDQENHLASLKRENESYEGDFLGSEIRDTEKYIEQTKSRIQEMDSQLEKYDKKAQEKKDQEALIASLRRQSQQYREEQKKWEYDYLDNLKETDNYKKYTNIEEAIKKCKVGEKNGDFELWNTVDIVNILDGGNDSYLIILIYMYQSPEYKEWFELNYPSEEFTKENLLDVFGITDILNNEHSLEARAFLTFSDSQLSDYVYLFNKEGKKSATDYLHAFESDINNKLGFEMALDAIDEIDDIDSYFFSLADTLKIGVGDGVIGCINNIMTAFNRNTTLTPTEYKAMYLSQMFLMATMYVEIDNQGLLEIYQQGQIDSETYEKLVQLSNLQKVTMLDVDLARGNITGEMYNQFQEARKADKNLDKFIEKLEEKGKYYNYAYQIGSNIGNMLPSQIAGIVTGGAGWASSLTLFISAYGGSYKESIRSGYDELAANIYAILSASSEVATEYFLGKIAGLSGSKELVDVGDDIVELASRWQIFTNMLKTTALDIFDEIKEEELQNVLDAIFKCAIFHEPIELSGQEMIDTAIITFFTTGLMNAPTNMVSVVGQNINYSKMQNKVSFKLADGSIAEITIQTLSEFINKDGKVDLDRLNTYLSSASGKGKVNIKSENSNIELKTGTNRILVGDNYVEVKVTKDGKYFVGDKQVSKPEFDLLMATSGLNKQETDSKIELAQEDLIKTENDELTETDIESVKQEVVAEKMADQIESLSIENDNIKAASEKINETVENLDVVETETTESLTLDEDSTGDTLVRKLSEVVDGMLNSKTDTTTKFKENIIERFMTKSEPTMQSMADVYTQMSKLGITDSMEDVCSMFIDYYASHTNEFLNFEHNFAIRVTEDLESKNKITDQIKKALNNGDTDLNKLKVSLWLAGETGVNGYITPEAFSMDFDMLVDKIKNDLAQKEDGISEADFQVIHSKFLGLSDDTQYINACNILLKSVNNDLKVKLKSILYEGKYGNYTLSSSIMNRDNATLEAERRLAAAYLLLKNPQSFDILIKNNVNLFHGTSGVALQGILEHGLNSGLDIERQGREVLTGEIWSRRAGQQRDFISFTDLFDLAASYHYTSDKISDSKMQFPIIFGTSADILQKKINYRIQTDLCEIAIGDQIKLDEIKVVLVPSDKVDLVKSMVQGKFEVVAFDAGPAIFQLVGQRNFDTFIKNIQKEFARNKINKLKNHLNSFLKNKNSKVNNVTDTLTQTGRVETAIDEAVQTVEELDIETKADELLETDLEEIQGGAPVDEVAEQIESLGVDDVSLESSTPQSSLSFDTDQNNISSADVQASIKNIANAITTSGGKVISLLNNISVGIRNFFASNSINELNMTFGAYQSFLQMMHTYTIDGSINELINFTEFQEFLTKKVSKDMALSISTAIQDGKTINIQQFKYLQNYLFQQFNGDLEKVNLIIDKYVNRSESPNYLKYVEFIKSFGLSEIDSRIVLDSIDVDFGICSFANLANTVIEELYVKYGVNAKIEFKKIFGYDLDANKLMIDIWMNTNLDSFVILENGKIKINLESLKNGRLSFKNQGLAVAFVTNIQKINSFFESKNIDLRVNANDTVFNAPNYVQNFGYNANFEVANRSGDIDNLLNKINNEIKDGRHFSFSQENYNLQYIGLDKGSSIAFCPSAHITKILGVCEFDGEKGLLVLSWAGEYFIKASDLIGKQFTIHEFDFQIKNNYSNEATADILSNELGLSELEAGMPLTIRTIDGSLRSLDEIGLIIEKAIDITAKKYGYTQDQKAQLLKQVQQGIFSGITSTDGARQSLEGLGITAITEYYKALKTKDTEILDLSSYSKTDDIIHMFTWEQIEEFRNTLGFDGKEIVYNILNMDRGKISIEQIKKIRNNPVFQKILTMTTDQVAGIADYTAENYRDINIAAINQFSREGRKFRSEVEGINTAIHQSGGLQEDQILYRGIRFDSTEFQDTSAIGRALKWVSNTDDINKIYDQLKMGLVGKSEIMSSFTSATSSIRSNFVTGAEIVLEIKAPKGTAAMDVSAFSVNAIEDEFLFAKDTKFTYDSVELVRGTNGKLQVLIRATVDNQANINLKPSVEAPIIKNVLLMYFKNWRYKEADLAIKTQDYLTVRKLDEVIQILEGTYTESDANIKSKKDTLIQKDLSEVEVLDVESEKEPIKQPEKMDSKVEIDITATKEQQEAQQFDQKLPTQQGDKPGIDDKLSEVEVLDVESEKEPIKQPEKMDTKVETKFIEDEWLKLAKSIEPENISPPENIYAHDIPRLF